MTPETVTVHGPAPVTAIVFVPLPPLAVTKPAPVGVAVCGAVQPRGTTNETSPFAMLPAAGVYVSVCVSPDCEADAVVNEVRTVPDPSAASFFSANRCAAQSQLVTHVAVLFPDAPAATWTPSANPAVTFVAPVEEAVHSRTRPWEPVCVTVTPFATAYAAWSISLAAAVVTASRRRWRSRGYRRCSSTSPRWRRSRRTDRRPCR